MSMPDYCTTQKPLMIFVVELVCMLMASSILLTEVSQAKGASRGREPWRPLKAARRTLSLSLSPSFDLPLYAFQVGMLTPVSVESVPHVDVPMRWWNSSDVVLAKVRPLHQQRGLCSGSRFPC